MSTLRLRSSEARARPGGLRCFVVSALRLKQVIGQARLRPGVLYGSASARSTLDLIEVLFVRRSCIYGIQKLQLLRDCWRTSQLPTHGINRFILVLAVLADDSRLDFHRMTLHNWNDKY